MEASLGLYSTGYGARNNVEFSGSFIFSAVLVLPCHKDQNAGSQSD